MRWGRSVKPWMVASAAVASVLCLVAPWARSGRVDRSTIDLLSSAGSLELLEGWGEVAAVGAWYALPLLAAAVAVCAGWHRRLLTAAFALPIGPLMLLSWWAVARSSLETRWGAVAGGLLGLIATSLGALVLMGSKAQRGAHHD